jgi:hypothetical protein
MKEHLMRSSLRRYAVVAVALAVFWVQSLHAQALKQVPADALVVLKINNLRQTSDKVSKLLNTLGVAQMTGIQDPLATIKQELGVNAGLKEDGEAIFAFIDPATTGVREDESMVILIPVSDYNAFVGNFQGAQVDGAVSSVQIQGEAAHISQWGEYAAISPSKQVVTTAPQTAMTVAQALTNDLQQSDMVMYANIEKIRALAVPELEKAKTQAIAEIDRELGRNEQQQKFAPVAKAAATQGINALQTFLNDANASAVSMTLSDGGIAIDAIADFKEGSYLGKAVSSAKGTNESLVRGLPSAEYLVYGGVAVDSEAVTNALLDFAGPILTSFAESQGKPAEGQKLLDATKRYLQASKRTSIGLVAPIGQLGQEAVIQMVSVTQGDAAAITAANKEMVEAQGALFGEMAAGEIAYNENAKTVGGVQFHETKVNINLAPAPAPAEGEETPEQQRARQRAAREAQQAQQALSVLYGPNGITQLNGQVGDKFLIASGVSDETVGKLVESAKADTDLLADRAYVQPVTQALPQERIAVVYLPLDQWAKTGSTYAGLFGFPVQLQLPPDLPPVGIAVATQGSQLRVESYIPVDLIQSLIAAGLQAAGGAGAGGGMGDPGGI